MSSIVGDLKIIKGGINMPKGVPASGKKQSNTKKSIREFNIWKQEKYPIYDEDGKQLVLKKDEVFVPVWDYCRKKKTPDGFYFVKVFGKNAHKKVRSGYKLQPGETYVLDPKLDKGYYVSNYGNVLSFKFFGIQQPLWMKKSESTNGYMQIGDNWRLHKLVWFSFMADALNGQQETDEELPYILPLSYGVCLESIRNLKNLSKMKNIEVHHIDSDTQNNSLENLEVLPEDVHCLLTDMKNTDNQEKQWQKFKGSTALHYHQKKATIAVSNECDVRIESIDQNELWNKFSSVAQAQVLNSEWYHTVIRVIQCVGSDLEWMKDEIYLVVEDMERATWFHILKKKNQITRIERVLDPSGIEADITYYNGHIYYESCEI